MKYEEFLLATNSLQDKVAVRFVHLYKMLDESAHPLPVKLLVSRVPDSTRGQLNYLLGLNGDPVPLVSEFFVKTQEGYVTLSPVGKQVKSHVEILATDLENANRLVRARVETSPAKLVVFETAYEEAKQELEKTMGKRINQLEMELAKAQARPVVPTDRPEIKDGPSLTRTIAGLIKDHPEIVAQIIEGEDFSDMKLPTTRKEAKTFVLRQVYRLMFAYHEADKLSS